MNAHIEVMLQASGTTRAIRWVKKSDIANAPGPRSHMTILDDNPDHAIGESAYRRIKAALAKANQ